MRYMLDTSICIAVLKGESEACLARLEGLATGQAATSSIVAAELLVGAARSNATGVVERFLDRVSPLPFDRVCAAAYGRLPFSRGSFDRLIAAHAMALDLILVTANEKDFRFPGLSVENWTTA